MAVDVARDFLEGIRLPVVFELFAILGLETGLFLRLFGHSSLGFGFGLGFCWFSRDGVDATLDEGSSSAVVFFLPLLNLPFAAWTEPLIVRYAWEVEALIMSNLVVTVLAHYLIILPLIRPAYVAKLSKLWSIVEFKTVHKNPFLRRWLLYGNLLQYFVGFYRIVLFQTIDLDLAERTQVMKLGPAENAIHTEGVSAVFRFCSF